MKTFDAELSARSDDLYITSGYWFIFSSRQMRTSNVPSPPPPPPPFFFVCVCVCVLLLLLVLFYFTFPVYCASSERKRFICFKHTIILKEEKKSLTFLLT